MQEVHAHEARREVEDLYPAILAASPHKGEARGAADATVVRDVIDELMTDPQLEELCGLYARLSNLEGRRIFLKALYGGLRDDTSPEADAVSELFDGVEPGIEEIRPRILELLRTKGVKGRFALLQRLVRMESEGVVTIPDPVGDLTTEIVKELSARGGTGQ